ncbi:unnamed protein product [Ilex paraguariensis]|uniref:Uncharacterized protein n=1 Tax=Ilex paraguariensis TaxID=185542 RepID=A0ABC8U732_9AQUA
MATSVESSSPDTFIKGSTCLMVSSPMFSPSSDKRFWSTLRSRIDTLLESRKPIDLSLSTQINGGGGADRAKRLKEDSLLLLRGFDSVGYSLSQLSHNLENALQGTRDLTRPPTFTDMVHNISEKANGEEQSNREEEKNEDNNRRLKRKFDSKEWSQGEDDSPKENGKSQNALGNLKKAKNLAISMATRAASLARELKSIKSDLGFMQERCALIEEENRRLREGFSRGMRPDEDDLVRLQLEALLAEKSRLANENANLTRENQCLHNLVEYHQLNSQDLSASYEDLIRGICLDFSSPPPSIPEEDEDTCTDEATKTPRTDVFGFSTSLDQCYGEEEQMIKNC